MSVYDKLIGKLVTDNEASAALVRRDVLVVERLL